MEKTKVNNKTLDSLKCLACMAVLFMHTNSGNIIDSVITCLCRFAVPLFFMVSGYYSFNTDRDEVFQRTNKKIKHITFMAVIATMIYFVWDWLIFNLLEQQPIVPLIEYIKISIDLKSVIEFILFNKTVFGGTLWFLFALIYCYGMFKIINRTKSEKMMYIVSIILIILHITSRGIIQYYQIIPEEININFYRNWLFMGLPFFMIGHLLNYYRDIVIKLFSNKALSFIILLGLILSCIERLFVPLELFFGTTAVVIALYIFAIKNPEQISNKLMVTIGNKYSMFIYLAHPIVNNMIYKIYFNVGISENIILRSMNPVVVFVITLLIAFLFMKIMEAVWEMKSLIKSKGFN